MSHSNSIPHCTGERPPAGTSPEGRPSRRILKRPQKILEECWRVYKETWWKAANGLITWQACSPLFLFLPLSPYLTCLIKCWSSSRLPALPYTSPQSSLSLLLPSPSYQFSLQPRSCPAEVWQKAEAASASLPIQDSLWIRQLPPCPLPPSPRP